MLCFGRDVEVKKKINLIYLFVFIKSDMMLKKKYNVINVLLI